MDDLYKVLQVDTVADPEVIEAAFRRLARKYHPDVNPLPEAAERMRDLNAAYGVLRDPEQRAEYDRRRTPRWRRWRRRPAPRTRRADGLHDDVQDARSGRSSCWRHAGAPAVDACHLCGSALCRGCAVAFEPSGCALCVLRLARRGQRRAVAGAATFVLAFLAVLYVALGLVGTGPGAGLLAAYLVAATALGIAVVAGRMRGSNWPDEPSDRGLGLSFLVWLGIVVGWLAAPVLLVSLARDLRRAWQLATTARAALEAG